MRSVVVCYDPLQRTTDAERGDIKREETKVQKAIKEAAKRNDMGSAKSLAKEIVRSQRTVNRLYENKAQLNSISMHLGESVAAITLNSMMDGDCSNLDLSGTGSCV
ncbi:putative vacuolar protein sorting-associated protein 24 -like protein 2 [Capsicum annuum]|nr:putative vacuolar protein sorting-associated protein 24 -like protein 2 [Capsicum annuum]